MSLARIWQAGLPNGGRFAEQAWRRQAAGLAPGDMGDMGDMGDRLACVRDAAWQLAMSIYMTRLVARFCSPA